MKRRHLFSNAYRSEEGINISPLIDIVFILLIFFIVSSVFQQQESIQIKKPEAESGVPDKREAIYITINREGRISLAGTSLSLGGIGPALQRLSGFSKRPVIVEVDRNVSAELLVNVVDQVRLTGNKSVHVSTQQH